MSLNVGAVLITLMSPEDRGGAVADDGAVIAGNVAGGRMPEQLDFVRAEVAGGPHDGGEGAEPAGIAAAAALEIEELVRLESLHVLEHVAVEGDRDILLVIV